jgi:hypothetical protein
VKGKTRASGNKCGFDFLPKVTFVVDCKCNNSLPVASGLSAEWVKARMTVKAQKTKKKGPTQVTQCMDDDAALSTRPDYPPSPTKFNRKVADAKLATARAGTS